MTCQELPIAAYVEGELDPAAERLVVAAGLGRFDTAGKLVVPKLGTRVHVGDLIRTDLPLAVDG